MNNTLWLQHTYTQLQNRGIIQKSPFAFSSLACSDIPLEQRNSIWLISKRDLTRKYGFDFDPEKSLKKEIGAAFLRKEEEIWTADGEAMKRNMDCADFHWIFIPQRQNERLRKEAGGKIYTNIDLVKQWGARILAIELERNILSLTRDAQNLRAFTTVSLGYREPRGYLSYYGQFGEDCCASVYAAGFRGAACELTDIVVCEQLIRLQTPSTPQYYIDKFSALAAILHEKGKHVAGEANNSKRRAG